MTLRVLFPQQYRRFCRRPLKKGKVLFLEANLARLSGSLRFLYDRLCSEKDLDVRVHYLQESGNKFRFIGNALRFLKDLGDAEYLFLCEGSRVVSCIEKRPETTVAQLWHGCGAFKKFGFSASDGKFGGSFEEYLKYNYYGNYDYVTVSSPEVAWAYREAMYLPEDDDTVVPIGVSCTDVLFQEAYRQKAFKKLYRLCPQARGKRVMLYAPTFRGSVGEARAPEKLDVLRLQEAFSREWVLIIKQHPMVKRRPEIPAKAEDFAFDLSQDAVIEELLCVSDLCISDYSSIVFEYSLFERPMIFFAFDFEEYGEWRGFYYDYDELAPGPVVYTTEEIVEYIRGLPGSFDRQRMGQFKDKFMSACDGCATQRLLDIVMKR